MNPHLSFYWFEIFFPFLMTVVIAGQFWWHRPARADRLFRTGAMLISAALAAASIANLYYQRVIEVRAWPTSGAFDQTLVTTNGEIFLKLGDPIMGRTNRVQLYGCDGSFKAAFEPDNGGGLFKIAVDADGKLLIYSVRTDSVDTFDLDGTHLSRSDIDSRDMPFEFLKRGPSVLKGGTCEFVSDPETGRPAANQDGRITPLAGGDWMLEYVLNRLNIFGAALLGAGLVAVSFIRERRNLTT